MNLNKSELIKYQYQRIYDQGTKEGSKLLMLLPISAMVFSLTFASLKVYDRVPKRLILVLSNALLVGVVLLTYFFPTKITFGMLVSTVGYFSVIINSAPFILIDIYRARENYPTNRGLANDNSVATLSASVGQMVGSLLIAVLIAKVPSAHIAMTILSSVCGTLNVFVCLCLLTYE